MKPLPKAVEDAIWDAGSGSSPTEEEAEAADALRKAVAAAIREAEDDAIERAAREIDCLDEDCAYRDRSGRCGPARDADRIRSLKHDPAPSPGEGGRR
jgi:hypothetical protein